MKFDIKQVAELARLNLSPDEAQKLEKNLESILDYVQKLDSLPTQDVEPTSHVLQSENVFREDEVKISSVRDAALDKSPAREGKFFKVPKVIERD